MQELIDKNPKEAERIAVRARQIFLNSGAPTTTKVAVGQAPNPIKLKDNQHAVVTGMSAPGTPGNPSFSIEIAQVYYFKDEAPLSKKIHDTHEIDHGFCIPEGTQRGWVGVSDSALPKDAFIELEARDDGKVNISLMSRHGRFPKPMKSLTVPEAAIKTRGFDLRNTDNTHGMKLSRDLSQYLLSFATADDQSKKN